MSCSCNCGCDGKYDYKVGGYRCYPLIVKISHPIDLNYTCQAKDYTDLTVAPEVSLFLDKECNVIWQEEKDAGGIRTLTYMFELLVKPGYECSRERKCLACFIVSPPQRSWHNTGSGDDDPPFLNYDSTNPECYVKCIAKMKDKSDSGEFYFEAAPNPTPLIPLVHSYIARPDQNRFLMVEVSDGDVSVSFEPWELYPEWEWE